MIGSHNHRESKISAKIPPACEDVLHELSVELGGVGYALRENSSLPNYEEKGAPKPPNVKGKLSNHTAVEGFLVVDSTILGKEMSTGEIKTHDGKAIPPNQPTMQARRSINYFLQGLNQKPPKFEIIGGKPTADGLLQVRSTSKNPKLNQIIFTIDLKSSDVKPPLKIDYSKVRRQPAKIEDKPSWWREEFGDFSQRVTSGFALEYQQNAEAPRKPVMIYALKDKNDELIPIISDQNLAWITLPKMLFKALQNEKKLYANEVMDTRGLKEDGTPKAIDMMNALVQLGQDIQGLKNKNGEPLLPKHEALYSRLEDIPKEDRAMIARLGVITPFEAYVLILSNKRFGIPLEHIRDLFQHGAENHSPYGPEDMKNINLVGGYPDERGNWHDVSLFVESERQLVNMLVNTPYLEHNVLTVHHNWNMEFWHAVVKRQLDLGHPVTDATLNKYQEFMEKKPDLSQPFTLATPTTPNLVSLVSDNITALARKNNWQVEEHTGEAIHLRIAENSQAIVITPKGIESPHSGEAYLQALAKVCDSVGLMQNYYIGDKAVRQQFANYLNQLHEPAVSFSRKE